MDKTLHHLRIQQVTFKGILGHDIAAILNEMVEFAVEYKVRCELTANGTHYTFDGSNPRAMCASEPER